MIRNLAVAAAAVVLLGAPAWAENTCVRPYAPAITVGGTATKEQMLTSQQDVKEFLRASDTFQECVLRDLQAQREAARRDQKTVDQSVIEDAAAKIDSNQREKVRVGAEYNAAVQAYNAAHPASH